jgi:hypothetical protein
MFTTGRSQRAASSVNVEARFTTTSAWRMELTNSRLSSGVGQYPPSLPLPR